jgi:hypothetical protein
MAHLLIPDKEELKAIVNSADKYKNIFALAEANGMRIDELEQAIRFHGLPFPVFLSQRELTIKEEFPRLHKTGMSLRQIAFELGLEPSELRYLVRKLSLDVFNPFSRIRDMTAEVKHIIETRGGTVRDAMQELGHPLTQTNIRRLTAELFAMGFETNLYRHIGKRAGAWLVIKAEPGQRPTHHRCICTNCGTIHEVNKNNFAAHSTLQCDDCRKKGRTPQHRFAVRNVNTGEVFRSVRAAHLSVQHQTNAQVFYRKMRRDGCIALGDGTRFELCHPNKKEAGSHERYLDYFYGDVGEHVLPAQLAPTLASLGTAVTYPESLPVTIDE